MFQQYYKLFLQVPEKLQLNWVKGGIPIVDSSCKLSNLATNSLIKSTSKLYQIINIVGSTTN